MIVDMIVDIVGRQEEKNMNNNSKQVNYTLEAHLGSISISCKGWNYDIRSWSAKNREFCRSITLTKNEVIKLRQLLNSLNI